MARSVWKGPFVEESLIKKVEKEKNNPNRKPIKTWSRKSTILPDFVGIMEKNLYQLQFLKTWLDISLENLRQQDSFLDIHQQTKKQKRRHLLPIKNKNEKRKIK